MRFVSFFRGIVVAVSALLAASCTPNKPVSATTEAPKPRSVRTATVKRETITRAIEASGTLAAQDRVVIAMRVTGRLQDVRIDLGDGVRKGDLIAAIDSTDLRIAIQQAEAALQQARTRLGLPALGDDDTVVPAQTPSVRQASAAMAEARLRRDRAQRLLDQKLIPQSENESALANFQIAESRYQDAIEEIRNRQAMLAQRRAELAMSRQQLTYATLQAPVDGAIAERFVSPGQFVAAGAPIAAIVTIHPLRLRLQVPERASGRVRVGQQVRLRVDQESETHNGRVARISPAIDETSRTLLIEAEIPNQGGKLRPGAFVRAEILSDTSQAALFVPPSALITFAGIERVLTVANGKAVDKLVKTGIRDGDRLEILEGLSEGETVILKPGNVSGGQPVTPAAN